MEKKKKFHFWVWLCRFAYRRATKGFDKKPVGLPGNRDPDHPCELYSPRKPLEKEKSFADCQTDGHYLCKNCALRDPNINH